jgi:hypothetical protein
LSKRSRRLRSHSPLALIWAARRRLATDRFAGAEEFKSLTGTKRNNEYKNIVDFGADRGFSDLRVGG